MLKFKPDTIYALEIDETELHDLELEISRINIDKIRFIPILCDVRNEKKLEKFFVNSKPEVVFHAAAYKHVPLTEEFPDEAVTTNILGTAGLAGLASKYGVEKFVNISTDKAVNPTSLMGATKRIAELVCIRENSKDTNYVSVRFGNVLGSRGGSVLTIFQNQIKNGGPVTITHRDMERYFMSIPEAVLLVFQAASMGEGGEVFILDMGGKPKKILSLAEELIKLQGFEPYEDIKIEFSGLRPGEKLYEELLADGESLIKTYHNKVFRAKNENTDKADELGLVLDNLKEALLNVDNEKIKKIIKGYIAFNS